MTLPTCKHTTPRPLHTRNSASASETKHVCRRGWAKGVEYEQTASPDHGTVQAAGMGVVNDTVWYTST